VTSSIRALVLPVGDMATVLVEAVNVRMGTKEATATPVDHVARLSRGHTHMDHAVVAAVVVARRGTRRVAVVAMPFSIATVSIEVGTLGRRQGNFGDSNGRATRHAE
jgi:hypothetical protein